MRALLVVVAALALAATAAAASRFTVQPVGITEGQTVSGTVHIEAQATADLQRVEISIDGRLRGIANRAPFAYDWETAAEQNGTHVVDLWAVARDGTVATARVTVLVANTFAVTLAAPAEGQQLSGVVHLAPRAAGLPAQWIEVLVDGELRWTLDRAPYGVDWNTALETAGAHTLTIRGVATGGTIARLDIPVVVGSGQTADARTLLTQTRRFRAQTWTLQSLMRVPRTPSAALAGTLAELVTWRSRAASAGLQMSFDFMKGYGPELFAAKGTADHWTPIEQMWVSERAWSTRGFQPWPTTARMCGLL